jgi:hypothetical protein
LLRIETAMSRQAEGGNAMMRRANGRLGSTGRVGTMAIISSQKLFLLINLVVMLQIISNNDRTKCYVITHILYFLECHVTFVAYNIYQLPANTLINSCQSYISVFDRLYGFIYFYLA